MVREQPVTAEELMRSRFQAFARGDRRWLLETWHPSTRPDDLAIDESIRWRGLQIVDTALGRAGDVEGTVEFRATYVHNGHMGVLHERSRFCYEDGQWYYLDGKILS